MADEYIKREAAISACYDGYADCRDDCTDNIRKVPAADVVEVVRCKDCEWWTKQEASIQGRCERLGMYPTGAWFCANGERQRDGYIDTGINASICNEWKTLQDDEEMLRAVGAKGESVTIDRKNKTLTCTDECGHTVIMNALKIIKNGEIVWSKDGRG